MMIGLCLRHVAELRQEQHQELQLEQLAVAGGATESVFPLVETLLESRAHRAALKAASRRRRDSGYRSVVDFVLVATFPWLRRPCMRFYAGDGDPIGVGLSEMHRCYLERRMVVVLELFAATHVDGSRPSWPAALEAADALEKAA